MDIYLILKVIISMVFTSFFIRVYNRSFKKDGYLGIIRKGFVIFIFAIGSISLLAYGILIMGEDHIKGIIGLALGIFVSIYFIHIIKRYISNK